MRDFFICCILYPMKLESTGILIALRPFGERDSIGVIFTHDYGVMTGMLTGAQVARKNKPLVGQVGGVSWNARLDSQLGAFHWEAEKNMAAPLMSDPRTLGIMNSMFALIAALLPEREKYETLFIRTKNLLHSLAVTPLGRFATTPPASGGRCDGVFDMLGPKARLTPLAGGAPTEWARGVNRCAPQAQVFAKSLRKNLTKHEAILWKNLSGSNGGFDFVKQMPIGNYIADFVNRKTKLIVELDGEHHGEQQQIYHDAVRDKFLQDSGYRTIRFWNDAVIRDLQNVLDNIYYYLTHENEIPPLQNFYPKEVIDNHPPRSLCDHSPRKQGETRQSQDDKKNLYLSWEINFLADLGYALDMSRCSGCGKKDSLNYLSPKTGRAVCDECAAPYLNRLHKLPLTLDVLKKFLERACEQHGITLPVARQML